MHRRHFLKASVATAASFHILPNSVKATKSNIIKPKRLQNGSTIGIVSPAGATFLKEELNIVIDAVKALGLIPKLAPHALEKYGYLAGKDKQRAADINQLFADRDVSAILPIRGGWGSSKILPYLDYKSIQKNPKILIGFSDITSLLLGLNATTNLVTFHGPNGLTSWRKTQTEYFRRVLFEGEKVIFKNIKDGDDANRLMQVKYRIQTIHSGKARGKLIGGNLSVISAIVGSPYLPDLNGAILFLEDTHENIYRVDRMMTHLKLAGIIDKLAGFIFGQCPGCSPGSSYGSLTLEEVVYQHIKPLGIPAWYGAMIGHLEPILTLPIGLQVDIDADTGTMRMLEAAVV